MLWMYEHEVNAEMVTIYTSDSARNKIVDIEARFRLLIKSGEKFSDSIYTQAMRYIDGIIARDNDIIENRFGRTLIENLSTGCKSVMLILLYRASEYIVSINECGENAVRFLFEIGDKTDVRAFTSSYIKITDNDIRCMIDGRLCVGGYQISRRLEELNGRDKV